MSKAISEEKKVISIKKIAEMNIQENPTQSPHNDPEKVMQHNVQLLHKQLHDLEKKKEKMLSDLRNAIHEEKTAWIEEKKREQEKAKEVGYKIGYDAGIEQALKENQSLIDKANQIVEAAKNDYYHKVEKHQEAIIQLSIVIAEKIMKQKMTSDKDYLKTLIIHAIEDLKDRSNITILLSPENYIEVMEQKEELEQVLQDDETISIYADQHLQLGDCIVKHPFGQIDVSIDVQLTKLKQALVEKITEN